ncbi:hypothetical protein [Niveispirillum sp.]|uniref:hypothetical protein n=1 Tax=Niveispirillum sp. TaxID=1917217 RepID=UPI001B68853E|nr:hypothetical protein [Niveispirillum sp.]MBP7338824.1 hypothetical protein [Niveispirillum sp.]
MSQHNLDTPEWAGIAALALATTLFDLLSPNLGPAAPFMTVARGLLEQMPAETALDRRRNQAALDFLDMLWKQRLGQIGQA